jgi:hypothetical protein
MLHMLLWKVPKHVFKLLLSLKLLPSFVFPLELDFLFFYAGQLVALILSNLKYHSHFSIIFQVDSNC